MVIFIIMKLKNMNSSNFLVSNGDQATKVKSMTNVVFFLPHLSQKISQKAKSCKKRYKITKHKTPHKSNKK